MASDHVGDEYVRPRETLTQTTHMIFVEEISDGEEKVREQFAPVPLQIEMYYCNAHIWMVFLFFRDLCFIDREAV